MKKKTHSTLAAKCGWLINLLYHRKVDGAHDDSRDVVVRRAGYPLSSILWAAGYRISGVDLSQSETASISGLHFEEKEFWKSSAHL